MEYTDLRYNILQMLDMDGIPGITLEQLIVFFGNEYPESGIKRMVTDMEYDSAIELNKTLGVYQNRWCFQKKNEELRRYINALWPVAYLGSENVRSITRRYYPTQYIVQMNSGKCYDYTLCDNKPVALMGKEKREMHLIKDVEDCVQHVAVINEKSKAFIETLGKYGYNIVAYHDLQTHNVEYLEIGKNAV